MAVRYTLHQQSILHQLPHNMRPIYEGLKDRHDNFTLFLATESYIMHRRTFPKSENLIEPIEGIITVHDVGCLERTLRREKEDTGLLKPEAVNFGIGHFTEWQAIVGHYVTKVFPLNTCQIDNYMDKNWKENVFKSEFQGLIRRAIPDDVFDRKYLVFPVRYGGDFFVTLVIDAVAAIEMKKKKGANPLMAHFGYKNMAHYQRHVVPHIHILLEKFVEVYGTEKRYNEYKPEAFEHFVRVLPELPREDHAFALFYMMRSIFRLRFGTESGDSTVKQDIRTLMEKDEDFAQGALDCRNELIRHIVPLLNREGTVQYELYDKRWHMARHEKEQREKKEKEEKIREEKEKKRMEQEFLDVARVGKAEAKDEEDDEQGSAGTSEAMKKEEPMEE